MEVDLVKMLERYEAELVTRLEATRAYKFSLTQPMPCVPPAEVKDSPELAADATTEGQIAETVKTFLATNQPAEMPEILKHIKHQGIELWGKKPGNAVSRILTARGTQFKYDRKKTAWLLVDASQTKTGAS